MFNISSCTSQNSTAIISSNTSPTLVVGERALDRHNPIITDERRRSTGTSTKKPCTAIHPLNLPARPKNRTLLKTNCSTENLSNKPTSVAENNNENRDNERRKVEVSRKSFSKTSEVIKKAVSCNTSKAGVDYITPSLESSTRYLLDADDSSYLDIVSDSDPVLKKEPISIRTKPTKPCSSAAAVSSDQVIMLRVSLHCRGCERKLKKHLSTMLGVTSFNIDFAAKTVTVIGDVTPVQVLSSISKVKTAKLWSSTMPSSSYVAPKQLVSY